MGLLSSAEISSFSEGWNDARANVSTEESYEKGKNNKHYRKGYVEGRVNARHTKEQDEKA